MLSNREWLNCLQTSINRQSSQRTNDYSFKAGKETEGIGETSIPKITTIILEYYEFVEATTITQMSRL